ncbi:MAG: dihydrolipoyllysine-residue succinyltransferase [Mariprofundaceae bacterium]|nr:dihydrolipoyllysine-residue succinyltransferase [Mariprofundaceae bacterium]
MADVKIKVPSLGESESEATLVAWLKQQGDAVEVDDVLAEIESDKITMEITALDAGVLKKVHKQVGDTVEPGEVIGIVDTSAARAGKKPEGKPEPAAAKPKPAKAKTAQVAKTSKEPAAKPVKPVAKVEQLSVSTERREERVPMSGLRRRVAQRLKEAQNTAAILTTFNEVNMHPVLDLRARYRESFKAKHGVDLGLMSFFVRACVESLQKFPNLNAYIEGDEIVYHNYADIGIAVSTDKGLVVPVLRDAGQMSYATIERSIAELALKAREGGLLPDDLKGGTFSITNGGVFGSLLSTPILNPPQSAILGMHTIKKRPVVEDDEIVIQPMMYLALSYDHRLIDGKEAVQFLVSFKELLEYPGGLLLDI